MYYYDPTYLLAILGLLLTLAASAGVKSAFSKYNKIRCKAGLTGAEAARRVLNSAGLYSIGIERVAGELTDHYDPKDKVLRLSQSTYGSASIAAVCVAAHECGHAIQDQQSYAPLTWRSSLVPAANLGAQLSWPIFFAGLIFSINSLLNVGMILFSLAVLFQLVTLPVEWNASSRALTILENSGMLEAGEMTGAKKVLRAAALTYVAALASSILQLLRLILLSRGKKRD